LERTSLYDDFPLGVDATSFSSDNFWHIWTYIWECAKSSIARSKKLHKHKDAVRTGHTRELTILREKQSFEREISYATRIDRSSVRKVLEWLSFNMRTPRKFTLFHCPLIEINRRLVLIVPSSVIMARVSTTFLRLLAHHDKNSLDAASTRLEKRKLNQIKEHMEADGCVIRTNVEIEYNRKKGELDLIEYDHETNTPNIAQAKFMIPPDSVSEVDSANKILLEGVKQLQENRELLDRKNLTDLIGTLGLPCDARVKVNYFLLPISFTGSDFLNLPNWIKVMPADFCLRPNAKSSSLGMLWNEYKELWDSLDEEVKLAKMEQDFELAGFRVVSPGFAV
jgi:hypothetical protein